MHLTLTRVNISLLPDRRVTGPRQAGPVPIRGQNRRKVLIHLSAGTAEGRRVSPV